MDIKSLTHSTSQFLHRFHVIVFVIIVLGALGVAIFIVHQNIVAIDNPNGYTAQTNNTSFDAATIERLDSLHPSDYRLPSDDPQKPMATEGRTLPLDGRVNAFVE